MTLLLILFTIWSGIVTQIHGEVIIDPSGPVFLPINTQRTITCNIENGTISNWFIFQKNGNVQGINPLLSNDNMDFPGITGRHLVGGFSTLLILVNTSDTSVTGLRCEGVNVEIFTSSAFINLTIYGIPSPPLGINVNANDNSLLISWRYEIIPTVNVTFTVSLIFSSLSQLDNITVYVTDTNTHTFILERVRSCDPFTMCITATNAVGQSDPSCVDNSLPYLPSTKDIRYSLLREGNTYSLNLTIQISQRCHVQEMTFLTVNIMNRNVLLFSQTFLASHLSTHIFSGLKEKSVYQIFLLSHSTARIRSSEVLLVRTGCIQCISICLIKDIQSYNISCEYSADCIIPGCRYILTGNNVMDIEGTITPDGYHIMSYISIHSYEYIRVSDGSINRYGQDHNLSEYLQNYCTSTETETTISCPSESSTALSFAVLESVIILGLLVLLAVLLYISRNNFTCEKIRKNCRTKKGVDDQLQQNQDLNCDMNPSYDTIATQQDFSTTTMDNKNPCYETIPL